MEKQKVITVQKWYILPGSAHFGSGESKPHFVKVGAIHLPVIGLQGRSFSHSWHMD